MTKGRKKKKETFKIPKLVDNIEKDKDVPVPPIMSASFIEVPKAYAETVVVTFKYLYREISDIKRRLDENVLISKEIKPLTGIDRVHVVQKGEKMSVIAKKELGSSGRFNEIATYNYDRYPELRRNPNDPKEGSVLRLPS